MASSTYFLINITSQKAKPTTRELDRPTENGGDDVDATASAALRWKWGDP